MYQNVLNSIDETEFNKLNKTVHKWNIQSSFPL